MFPLTKTTYHVLVLLIEANDNCIGEMADEQQIEK